MSTKNPATKDHTKSPASQELSDDQLDAVSGGAGTPTFSETVITKVTGPASTPLIQAVTGAGNASETDAAALAIPLPK
jgi:hypothetical protein